MDANNKEYSNNEYDKIEAIKTSVGGNFGGSYEVDIDIKNKELVWTHSLKTHAELYEKTIEESTLTKLIEGLKKLNILDWEPKYSNSQILDGTSWYVEMIIDGEKIVKEGVNEFSDQWNEFCDLMKAISGKDFH